MKAITKLENRIRTLYVDSDNKNVCYGVILHSESDNIQVGIEGKDFVKVNNLCNARRMIVDYLTSKFGAIEVEPKNLDYYETNAI